MLHILFVAHPFRCIHSYLSLWSASSNVVRLAKRDVKIELYKEAKSFDSLSRHLESGKII